MRVEKSRVGIVGGSIAGCAAAIALSRLGCDVTVLERSSGALQDRGAGIAIPNALRQTLCDAGYLPADYRHVASRGRRWVVNDGTPLGRIAWGQAGALTFNNWSVLWRGLRERVPEGTYRDGVSVLDVSQDEAGVALELGDGTTETFDVVIGADGYRSTIRRAIASESTPVYAGYILWRGNFPAAELSDREAWAELLEAGEWLTVCFEGGHAVMYPIPDCEGDGLRVNWAVYAPTPKGLQLEGPTSIPPGRVTPDVLAAWHRLRDSFPEKLRPLFAGGDDLVSIQPVYDDAVERYRQDRIALIGDAATLSRPHTGSGATKAMQDARLLEQLGAEHTDWSSLLAAYDEERTPEGHRLVALGRRIGRDQVDDTPPWADMSPTDFEAWTAGTLSGDQLYFWGKTAASQP